MNNPLPYTMQAAEAAAQALDVDEIRAQQEADDSRSQFIARDGRTEDEQLRDLWFAACNKMANHLATEGCFKCARTFVRGFTSTGPNPEQFCRRGMDMLIRIAVVTSAMTDRSNDATTDPSSSGELAAVPTSSSPE